MDVVQRRVGPAVGRLETCPNTRVEQPREGDGPGGNLHSKIVRRWHGENLTRIVLAEEADLNLV